MPMCLEEDCNVKIGEAIKKIWIKKRKSKNPRKFRKNKKSNKMSPMPKGTRFRFKSLGPKKRQRLAFKNSKVIEITGYKKKNGWVRGHTKRIT